MIQALTRLHVFEPVAMLVAMGSTDENSLGKNIAKARLAAGHTNAAAFARLIGVSPGTLGDWEAGRYTNLSTNNLIRIAKGAKCQLDDLVAGMDDDYDKLLASSVQKETDAPVIPATKMGVAPTLGGTPNARSSSSPSRVFQKRIDRLIRGNVESANQLRDIATALAQRNADLAALAEGDVSDASAAPDAPPRIDRGDAGSNTGDTTHGKKGRRR